MKLLSFSEWKKFLLGFFLSFLYAWFFPVQKRGKVNQISYYLGSQRYSVFLPQRLTPGDHVYLVQKNGEILEITQQSGVPYVVSAEDFQADHILVESFSAAERRFSGKEIPQISWSTSD